MVGEKPSGQSKSVVDQAEQTVQGNQTNIAGNYTVTSTYVDWMRSNTVHFYGFIIGVLGLVALVILYLISQGNDGVAGLVTTTPTDQATTVAMDKRAALAATAATTSEAVVTESPTEERTAVVATIPVSLAEDCLAQYVADFPVENVATFEEGIPSQRVQRNEVDELILRLTEFQEPIGLVHVLLLPDQKSFKIKTILDGECEPIAPEGGAGVNNWSVSEFYLQGVRYGIQLGYYSPTEIRSGGLRRIE